ncbi:protein DEHYDRATION-INDUCED 19 homolog 2-like [Zingiber officinale]|uniref:protein DEHYDRATION-INDUCED 19 homolog 2-like n=1 Tax=Zingiber officinale TaxID=94328 RepID=UPI001C4AACE3|nr:protein DEHYDRATION-INDUCED 19 homolog 2-like [Zingiber officinale]
MVTHITTEHASIFKIQRRRRLRKGYLGSYSTHSLLRKDLHEDNLHSLLGDSIGTSNAAPDPLLSSFMFNVPVVDTSDEQPEPLAEETSAGKVSDEKLVESATPSHSDKNLEESARRSEFVRQLVLSTMFDDDDA